jgi:hypothetical protein
VATVPAPSKKLAAPVPAMVLTTPVFVIMRILLLFVSAMKMLLYISTATPKGVLNLASAILPSVAPAEPDKPEYNPTVVGI